MLIYLNLSTCLYMQGVITKNGNDTFDISSFAKKITGNSSR